MHERPSRAFAYVYGERTGMVKTRQSLHRGLCFFFHVQGAVFVTTRSRRSPLVPLFFRALLLALVLVWTNNLRLLRSLFSPHHLEASPPTSLLDAYYHNRNSPRGQVQHRGVLSGVLPRLLLLLFPGPGGVYHIMTENSIRRRLLLSSPFFMTLTFSSVLFFVQHVVKLF